MVDITISNCRIVSPSGIFQGGIAISGEKIVEISTNKVLPEAKQNIDAKSNYVIPGVIDAHCHVGWPDWPIGEAYERDSEAAAIGGVTTIIDRVTLPPGSLVDQIFGNGKRKEILEKNAYVDVALQASLFTMDQIEEVPELVKRGIVGFKFYIPYKGPEAVPPMVGIDDGIVYFGFEKIAKIGLPAHAQIHAENIEIFFKFKDKFLREKAKISWYETRPNFCEIEPLIRCGYFSKITGCPVYVVHMSVKEGPEIVAKLKGEGVKIVAETCPQYLVCTKDNTDRILGKVNPPLRTREDNEGLWEGIRKGLITNLGSDHAPCSKKHKEEFWSAVVGMAGIETMFPVMLSEGVNKGRISLEKLVEIGCYNNAMQFGLLPRKGTINVGSDADIVIVDLSRKVKIEARKLHHISDFTPYEGWEITGWPILTMVRGKIVMEDGKIVGEPGYGKYIATQGIDQ
jgi:dihydroorotase (multifunctional complex type)